MNVLLIRGGSNSRTVTGSFPPYHWKPRLPHRRMLKQKYKKKAELRDGGKENFLAHKNVNPGLKSESEARLHPSPWVPETCYMQPAICIPVLLKLKPKVDFFSLYLISLCCPTQDSIQDDTTCSCHIP